MNCEERAISFGVNPELLNYSSTWCMDLPCFKNCPILASYPKEENGTD